MQTGRINSVAVIGDGKMGKGLFNHLVKYPLRIAWINIGNPDEEQIKFTKKVNRLLKCGSVNNDEYEQMLGRVKITNDINAIRDYSLIIETITEDINLKNKLFAEVEKCVSGECIVVSNSSSILPSCFNLSAELKKRFAGLHFFYPVETSSIVELISSDETEKYTTEALTDFCAFIGKNTLLQNNVNAFAANRFFLEIQSGLFNYCIKNNIPFKTADKVISDNFFSPGIFESMDIIGSEILLYAVKNYSEMKGNPEGYKYLIDYLDKMVSSGSKGFFQDSATCTSSVENVPDFQINQIITFVRNLFDIFVKEYLNQNIVSQKEVLMIIEEYSRSDYNSWK